MTDLRSFMHLHSFQNKQSSRSSSKSSMIKWFYPVLSVKVTHLWKTIRIVVLIRWLQRRPWGLLWLIVVGRGLFTLLVELFPMLSVDVWSKRLEFGVSRGTIFTQTALDMKMWAKAMYNPYMSQNWSIAWITPKQLTKRTRISRHFLNFCLRVIIGNCWVGGVTYPNPAGHAWLVYTDYCTF